MARTLRNEILAELAPKYVWWALEGSEAERNRRILAQIMNLGTYDDIRRIESVFDASELAEVLVHAQAGWFSPRSWSFWKGRLGLPSAEALPETPPRRSLDAAALPAQV